MITYHPSYNAPVKPKRIKFSIISPEEVRRMSVVSIKESTIYYRGLPNSGGINDALMGTVDRRLLCGTCMKDVKLCQGHIGHIELPYPMYHISFFDTVLKILRITCFACARSVHTENENISLNSEERKNLFNTVYNNSKTKKKCPHCGMNIPNYVRQTLGIKIDWPSDTVWESPEEKQYCNLPFTAREALSILTHIPDEDYIAMGFEPKISHPKNMILTVIVVPPPITRPAIMQSEGSRSRGQNDLTLKLQDISKKCIDLRATISSWKTEKITSDLQDKLNKLQLEVFTVVNNSVRGQKQSTQRSGAPIKAIVDRIKGKDGRIRGNLMGKRVDFSSRSVISPCPYMDIDCVGVPEKIAMQLTVPERVTRYNIDSLLQRVRNGAKHINGAETVITKENAVIQLQYCKNLDEIVLKPGDIVERFLKDNDTVVFNRQPSLHKMGMMAHRVRIVKGLTFRLNLVCTSSYNADFDGDEMNLHVPQSSAAIADAAMLMTVTQQIISPQSNKPVIGIVQDSLLGGHLLSQDDVLLNHKHACQICGSLKHAPKKLGKPAVIVKGKKYWTGKQLLSIILPDELIIDNSAIKDINYDDKNDVVIRNGKLHYGILTKKMLGTAAGGIIDVCCREFGNNVASKFMSDEQRMTNSYLLLKGFSVGISDCILSQEGHQRVNERLEKATTLCEEIMREVNRKDTPAEVKQNAESTIMRILSKTLMQTGSIVNECMSDNAIKTMVTCMSKGTPINLSQICGTVGQQSVEGSRIHAEKGSRTLPCFKPNENTLTSSGFVHNSYALGLTPSEFFYHAMGGREGLVDTAVKTSVTGYIQRRQIKSMEDNKVAYDGTVRDSMDGVVDFFWGGDGLDSSKLERVKLNVFTEKVESVRKRLTDVEFNTFMNARNNLLSTRLLPTMPSLDSRVLLPFNPKRLKQNLVYTEKISDQIGEKAASEELIKLILVCNTNTLRIAVVDSFNSKEMAKVHKDSFAKLFKTINERIENAKISAGEMVGSIAAQSVGEPATQMCATYFTQVMVAIDGKSVSTSIGELIDSYLPEITSPTQHDVMEVRNLKCVGVSPTENVSWTDVTHISRHPANGDIITVTTEYGRKLKMTASHSFLVRRKNRVVETPGYTLNIGDFLPLVKNMPINNGVIPSAPIPLNKATGRFIGAIVSKGCVNGNQVKFDNSDFEWLTTIIDDFSNATDMKTFRRKYVQTGLGTKPMMFCGTSDKTFAEWVTKYFGRTTHNKTLPGWILDAPEDFVTGLLQTFYDGDGNVDCKSGHHQIRCHTVSDDLAIMLSLCLARFGIPTYHGKEYYMTPDEKKTGIIQTDNGEKRQINRITIPLCFAAKFQEKIGFSVDYKVERLKTLVDRQETKNNPLYNFQTWIPGMNEVLEEIRSYIPCGGNRNSYETLLRKEYRRIQRKKGITPSMLMRCKEQAIKFNAPQHLIEELDYAINADVWWDPIVSIEIENDSKEMVYDFTVNQKLQSFMLSNGIFVHNTLNTFHSAGIGFKNVTLGIPRLKELLDVSKNSKTPSTVIRFKKPFSLSEEFVTYFANTLPLIRLGDLISNTEILYDPDFYKTTIKDDEWLIESTNILCGEIVDENSSSYIVRLTLNQNIMKTRFLTPPMIRDLLKQRLGTRAQILSSEINCIDWIIRIRFARVSEMMKAVSMTSDREIVLCHRVTSSLIETMAISGHPKVQTASCMESEYQYVDKHGNVVTEKEYIINTLGCCLSDICSSPCVDWYRTTSNDITEIIKIKGLEATCAQLYEQLNTVVSFDGTYIDPRHLTMLVNTMCRSGQLMALNRHGINRNYSGPLGKCSFEETPDVLCEAAVFGEIDNANGVSSSIMTGQLANIGTGTCDVLFNTENMNIRDVDINPKPRKKKILKSTVRSHTNDFPIENIEYVYDNREKPIGPIVVQKPFEDGCVECDEDTDMLPFTNINEEPSSPVRKRVKFRPSSPE